MKRKTIIFDDESYKIIEDYRRMKTPIPSFSEAVVEIVKEASPKKQMPIEDSFYSTKGHSKNRKGKYSE